MKKLIITFILFIFSMQLFATDIRQVIFGNNFETIQEINSNVFLSEYPDVRDYVSKIELGDFNMRNHDKDYFRVFEQIIGGKGFIRILKSVNPLTDEFILFWRNPEKINDHENHAYITQVFYISENEQCIAILPFCRMDADGYSWENGTSNKYEMVEIIQRNGKVKGFLFNRLVDVIDHHNREEESGKYSEKYENTAQYYLFDDVISNATNESGKIKYVEDYSAISYVAIEASQPLVDSKRPFMYTVNNAFDGNPATAYVENTNFNYIGLTFRFYENINFSSLKIINGYAASQNLYYENNAIKTIEIGDEYSTFVTKTLKQNLDYQKINYSVADISCISFYSKELYEGKKYSDTCISELDFYDENSGWMFGN